MEPVGHTIRAVSSASPTRNGSSVAPVRSVPPAAQIKNMSSSASIKLKVNHVSLDLNAKYSHPDNADKARTTGSNEDRSQSSHGQVTVETPTGQRPITAAKRSDSDNKYTSQMSTSIDAQENPGSKSHKLDPDKCLGLASTTIQSKSPQIVSGTSSIWIYSRTPCVSSCQKIS